MKNNLLPIIKLPYNVVKGSIERRQQKADKLVERFYQDLYPKFQKCGYIRPKQLEESMTKVLPPKLKITLEEGEAGFFDAWSDVIPSNGKYHAAKINKMTIGISNEHHKKIPAKYLPTIIHEMQHIADSLYHPKHLARNQYIQSHNLDNYRFDQLYENFLYNLEDFNTAQDKISILKKLEYRIKKFLKRLSVEEKINYLQDIRYTILQEQKAYNTEFKYAKKLKKKHFDVTEDSLTKNNDFMFPEKLALLGKMIAEIIKRERGFHAAKIKKMKAKSIEKKPN
ncbi:MAG: hypothetical protein E7Z87_05035 [Cyanobacteria bacterium SIG26]|nr:hypothetical protein [Cyanobacteria bacterium SIG26]